MKFYRAIDAAGKLRLATTQVGAKAINKDFDDIDVPTDKPGLHAFLSELLDQVPPIAPPQDGSQQEEQTSGPQSEDLPWVSADESPATEPAPSPAPTVQAAPVTQADDVIHFILNEARTHQVEQIFSALGTRFAEETGR